jgi:hypothetical protein
MSWRLISWTRLGGLAIVGCVRFGPPPGSTTTSASACRGESQRLGSGVQVEALAGTYTFTMAASVGRSAGRGVTGVLLLIAHTDSLRYLTTPDGPNDRLLEPLYGALEIDITAVNAVAPGSLDVVDPMRPGIAVVETRLWRTSARTTDVVFYAGSDGNRREVMSLDGPYLYIRPTRFAAGWVAGEWRSGESHVISAGTFCAIRTSPAPRALSNRALELTNAGDFGSGGLTGARSPRFLLSVRSRTPFR